MDRANAYSVDEMVKLSPHQMIRDYIYLSIFGKTELELQGEWLVDDIKKGMTSGERLLVLAVEDRTVELFLTENMHP